MIQGVNQCNTDKQNYGKKNLGCWKILAIATFLSTKVGEVKKLNTTS